jgi:hypothetical protein
LVTPLVIKYVYFIFNNMLANAWSSKVF